MKPKQPKKRKKLTIQQYRKLWKETQRRYKKGIEVKVTEDLVTASELMLFDLFGGIESKEDIDKLYVDYLAGYEESEEPLDFNIWIQKRKEHKGSKK